MCKKLLSLCGISSVLLFALHCGNASLYDDAFVVHYRVVRSGLNEWYPLDGNFDSRVGSASGTATTYSTAPNRDGVTGKAVCTSSGGPFVFGNSTFGTPPFTVSAWVKFDTLPGASVELLARGQQQTVYHGFKIDSGASSQFSLRFGNGFGPSDKSVAGPAFAIQTWYYLAFTYDGSVGSYYAGAHGGNLASIGSAAGPYTTDSTNFQIFTNSVVGCADDLLHYNRALSAQELEYNFLSLE